MNAYIITWIICLAIFAAGIAYGAYSQYQIARRKRAAKLLNKLSLDCTAYVSAIDEMNAALISLAATCKNFKGAQL